MEMKPVEGSTSVIQEGFEDGTLRIMFQRGDVYNYYGVPAEVYQDFLKSESKGKFIRSGIMRKYRAEKEV